jgi:hypothetical protein
MAPHSGRPLAPYLFGRVQQGERLVWVEERYTPVNQQELLAGLFDRPYKSRGFLFYP